MEILPGVSLVIPLHNNQSTLTQQLETCDQILRAIPCDYEIIICDDMSTDNSASLLRQYFDQREHFTIIFHQKNLGIAATISELYHRAQYQYIVLFSVDGDWDPYDIEKLIRTALKENCDIVVGKRNKRHYSNSRKIISFFYNFLSYAFFGVRTYDAGSIKLIKK